MKRADAVAKQTVPFDAMPDAAAYRAALGDDAYLAAWAKRWQMGLDETIAFALREREESRSCGAASTDRAIQPFPRLQARLRCVTASRRWRTRRHDDNRPR